jgi:ketosteroid isomerase-like protein
VVTHPTATPRPAPATPEEAVLAVVADEAEAVRRQDLDALAQLWLDDAVVTDARHTPDDPADDVVWRGWEQVRDRYHSDVFPYAEEPALVPRPRISVASAAIDGETAEVLVPGPDGRTTQDRWELRRRGDGWAIVALTFNLAPAG